MNDLNNDIPLSAKVMVVNQRGLHARAAAKVVKLMGQYQADISLINDGVMANARSIMGLMMLGASLGTELEIQAMGSDSASALAALVSLIERKFDEDR